MASQIPIGGVVRFTNPNDGSPDVGKLLGFEGGDLKVMTRDGIIYVYPEDVLTGGRRKSRKFRKSRKSRKSRNRR
jgi:hypothetical protein